MPASSAITSKHACVPHRSAARGMMIAVLAVLTALLASAPAGALVPAGNLVVNPGTEQGSAATDEFHVFAPRSWSASAGVTQLKYGTTAFPGTDVSNQIGAAAHSSPAARTPRRRR